MRELDSNEIKIALVDVLREIDEFCTENDITYFTAYGTLLGVVRHKGFIPWDDDVDIMMFREDYQRFISTFHPTDKRFCLTSAETDKDYPYTYAKVYDRETVVIEYLYKRYRIGVYVDIFPLDSWGDCGDKNLKRLYWYGKLLKGKTCRFSSLRSLKINLALAGMKLITLPFKKRWIIQRIDSLSQEDSDSKYCGNLAANSYGRKDRWPKAWFGEIVRMPFENVLVNVPKEYDSILRTIYGEYMVLPPEEERVPHHSSTAWKKS